MNICIREGNKNGRGILIVDHVKFKIEDTGKNSVHELFGGSKFVNSSLRCNVFKVFDHANLFSMLLERIQNREEEKMSGKNSTTTENTKE